MSDLAYRAMRFATEVHQHQRRKYTGNPYIEHLAEVTAIAMSVGWQDAGVDPDKMMAVCWLHDSVEDQGVSVTGLHVHFGGEVATGVLLLSDLEQGNRAERKAASRARLADAPGWVQTIKCADLISNTKSIVEYDPKFAAVYLEEKRALLEMMTKAHPALRGYAMELAVRPVEEKEGESREDSHY